MYSVDNVREKIRNENREENQLKYIKNNIVEVCFICMEIVDDVFFGSLRDEGKR